MKKFNFRIFLIFFLFVQLIFIQIMAHSPLFVEKYYANGIYPYIAKFWRTILGWIPFSVGDILLFILVLLFIKTLFNLIKKRVTIKQTCINITACASVLLFFFYFNWGFNYFRQPLSKKLQFTIDTYSDKDLETLSLHLINKTNSLQADLMGIDSLKVLIPYTRTELYKMGPKGYDKLGDMYPFLKYQTPAIKSSLMSTFQSYIGVGGYLNPLTGEAHVNANGLKTNAPSTISHEMAHQIGYAAENEAEFIGFLASTQHPDSFFKYSGYKNAMLHSVFEMRRRDSVLFKKLFTHINKGVKKDLKANYDLQLRYKNPFEPYVKKGYNLFLKSNKQKHGIHSYNRMVLLLINYYAQKTGESTKEIIIEKKES
ncbi:MAG: hypothetical protein COB60_04590 [Flavobacteriaceae bacterium]|nr:MAG: hypothetical protein COB60_04590 [Flavobacteriaceae bacterium]